jgi:hypothetical protein
MIARGAGNPKLIICHLTVVRVTRRLWDDERPVAEILNLPVKQPGDNRSGMTVAILFGCTKFRIFRAENGRQIAVRIDGREPYVIQLD